MNIWKNPLAISFSDSINKFKQGIQTPRDLLERYIDNFLTHEKLLKAFVSFDLDRPVYVHFGLQPDAIQYFSVHYFCIGENVHAFSVHAGRKLQLPELSICQYPDIFDHPFGLCIYEKLWCKQHL
jgi:hypothetical protein